MTQDIFAFLRERLDEGEPAALITVTETYGSSPASVGQIMAVSKSGKSLGTAGGGASEYKLISMAKEFMEKGEKTFDFSFDHAENGMVCGGGMKGFGNIFGSENHLYIFGGGHIGQALAKIAVLTGFYVTVVEDRQEFRKEFENVKYISCDPEKYSENLNLNNNSYVVICTRGHKTDDIVLRFCLNYPLKYIGMVGSSKKVAQLFSKLTNDGYKNETLANIYTPVGLDIASEVPAEIAVSVMAEILLIKNNGNPKHKSHK